MIRLSKSQTILAGVLAVIAGCESSDSYIADPSSTEGQPPLSQPTMADTMTIEGVELVDDRFVWDMYYQDEDAEPGVIDGVVLNTAN